MSVNLAVDWNECEACARPRDILFVIMFSLVVLCKGCST